MNSIAFLLSFFTRIISAIILLRGVFPVMFLESKIGNGIGFIRKCIMAGFIFYLISLAASNYLFICSTLGDCILDEKVPFIQMLVSSGNLGVAVALYLIYHKRYN